MAKYDESEHYDCLSAYQKSLRGSDPNAAIYYLAKMLCACIVEPNLYDKELQDSYDVMTPEDLLQAMVDDPGEYQDFATFVQNFNGFNTTLEDKVDEAKN